jgi:hypothetical protein
VLAPAALAGLAVIGLSACSAAPAGGTQTYRAHGVTFSCPAGWQEGSPAVTESGAPQWAAAFGPGPSAWMDIRASRTGLTSPITAGNIDAVTPSAERAVRRLFTMQAGPQRITIGGMPGHPGHGAGSDTGLHSDPHLQAKQSQVASSRHPEP